MLLWNVRNNEIKPVRPTFVVRLDTAIGPVVHWKYLTVTSLYHIYRYVQNFCLIYEINRQNTLRPTVWTTLLPTPLMICGPILVYYFNIPYFAQMNAILLKLFVFSVVKSRKAKKKVKIPIRRSLVHCPRDVRHSNYRSESLKEMCLKTTRVSKIVKWLKWAKKFDFREKSPPS